MAALFRAYQQSEASADKLYKGKTITVSGVVYDAGVNPYTKKLNVSLKEGSSILFCDFPSSAQSSVTALRAGQQATVRGVCDGTLTRTSIGMKNCAVVSR
jgi:hypothetical protein